jgi:hypothetical protein
MRKPHTSWHNQVGYCFVSNNDIEIFPDGQGWWWWACLEGEPPTSPARGPFVTSGEAFRDALRNCQLGRERGSKAGALAGLYPEAVGCIDRRNAKSSDAA